MRHTRGKPYHPMTQGKIERWHLSLKSRNPARELLPARRSRARRSPPSSSTTITAAITRASDNLTPADVYFGRGARILERRERIKRQDHRTAPPPALRSRSMNATIRWAQLYLDNPLKRPKNSDAWTNGGRSSRPPCARVASKSLDDVDLGRQIARDFEPDCLLPNLRFVPALHDFFYIYFCCDCAAQNKSYAVSAISPNLFSVTL